MPVREAKPTLRQVRAFERALLAVRTHPAADGTLLEHADTLAAMFTENVHTSADAVAIVDAIEFLSAELAQLNSRTVARIAASDEQAELSL